MSSRGRSGGGAGGRSGGRNVQGQQSPFPRGGGERGRGRGRNGGGGGGGEGSRGGRGSITSAAPSPSASPSVTEIGSSSSSAMGSLSHDLEKSVTLQETASVVTPVTVTSEQNPTPASSKALKHPARPAPGSAGMKCVVRANHFLVNLANRELHHYDVSISPEVTSRGLSRAVMSLLVEMYRMSHMGNLLPVYDGRKSLYTAGPLPFNAMEFVINLADKDGNGSSTRRERKFKVVIKLASRPDLHHLRQFLAGRLMDAPQETIQALDVVMRETPSNAYVVVGRSFFSPSLGQGENIGDGLECWKGYYQSIRATQMGPSLIIDLSATSFYPSINVIEYVIQFLNIRDTSRNLSDVDRIKIKKSLRGVRVELLHRKGNRKRISSLTAQSTSQLTFPAENGNNVSVVRYFQEKYGIRMKYPHWPCLQAGNEEKPVYLPMEMCKIVEGQKYSKKLNEKQVTGILRAACQRPKDRENGIKKIVGHNNYRRDAYAQEFGIEVSDTLTTINSARVLPPPMLRYHDTGWDVKIQPRVGQWNMINTKMVNGATVEHWACLNFSSLNEDAAFNFFWELVSMCTSKGIVFSPKPLLPMRSSRPNQIERALIDLHKEALSRLAKMEVKVKQLQLLIIILPDKTGSYGKIKTVCETELGIVSQCCQPRQAAKLSKQYLENVSLKINVKVGGRNNVLEDVLLKRLPYVSDRPTIIFGADVTHPQAGEDSGPSIAAVVASMDWPEVSKYRCLVSAQTHRQELISDLYKVQETPKGLVHGGMIREHLIAFRRSTGYKPHRIIFYRDGVSEGQFAQVLLHEIDAIRRACASLEEGYLPPITFVVVQKRHHTRLFPANHMDRNMTDRSGNILPGTVVDTMICHPTEFDFYLCSHAGIQGTSRPTHYHVLWDENKFTSDGLQMLTNNLCYTYARCTRSVSIVPPAYYAHLGAFRARYYIEGDSVDGSSDAGSSSGGSRNTRTTAVGVRPLPQIKDCVKDVMFFC